MQDILIHKLIEKKAKPTIINWATHNSKLLAPASTILSIASMALHTKVKELNNCFWEGPSIEFYNGMAVVEEFGANYIAPELHSERWMRAQWKENHQGLILRKFTPAKANFDEYAIRYSSNYTNIDRVVTYPKATFFTISDHESYSASSWVMSFRPCWASWHHGQGDKNYDGFSEIYDITEDGLLILANLIELKVVGDIANFDSSALVYKLSF